MCKKKTSAAKAPAPAKTAKEQKPNAPEAGEKKMSLVKAAIAILERTEEALGARQLVERAKAEGLWTPGAGKTPEQTLYSALVREIKTKGDAARVTKENGLFRIRR